MKTLKKTMLGLLAAAAVICTSGVFAAAETEIWENPRSGVDVAVPGSWVESGYYMTCDTNEITSDLVVTYAAMFSATEEELVEAQGSSDTEMDYIAYVAERYNDLFLVASVRGDQGYEDLMDSLLEGTGAEDPDDIACELTELGTEGDWTYYSITGEDVLRRPEPVAGSEETMEQILADLPEAFENMRFYEPVEDPKTKAGTQLSFTTVDFDGNEVDSRELFSQHTYTMVSLWMSWCQFCVGELPELEEINKEFAEDNCAIIGVMLDGDQEKELQTGKEHVAEAGVTFPMLIPTEEMKEQLIAVGYPTTIFVDSNGVVVGEPIRGVNVEGYRERMKELVAGAASEEKDTEAAEASGKEPDPAAEEAAGYRIIVLNEDKEPVPDVMVQFCSDTECMMDVTGEDGTAVFDVEAGTYAVHILKVPDGYAPDTEEYAVSEEPGSITVTLQKA